MSPTPVTQSIAVEYVLPQPPEKVWRTLTEPELLAAWLMPNDFRPVLGHHFTFQAPPMHGWDGIVHCEVLAIEPHQRLSYSWRGGPEGAHLDTTVTWLLTAAPSGGTLLRLDHAGFTPKNAFAFGAMSKGWSEKLARRIAEVLATLG